MRVVRKETGGVYDLLGLKVLKTKSVNGDMVTVTVQEVPINARERVVTYYPGTFCYRSLREFFENWEDAPRIEENNG